MFSGRGRETLAETLAVARYLSIHAPSGQTISWSPPRKGMTLQCTKGEGDALGEARRRRSGSCCREGRLSVESAPAANTTASSKARLQVIPRAFLVGAQISLLLCFL